MTTSQTPTSILRKQAEKMAERIKALERGDPVDPKFAAHYLAARSKPEFKFGVVMDDKTLIITMPWTLIHSTGEVGLTEFILKHMKNSRETTH